MEYHVYEINLKHVECSPMFMKENKLDKTKNRALNVLMVIHEMFDQCIEFLKEDCLISCQYTEQGIALVLLQGMVRLEMCFGQR